MVGMEANDVPSVPPPPVSALLPPRTDAEEEEEYVPRTTGPLARLEMKPSFESFKGQPEEIAGNYGVDLCNMSLPDHT